MTECHRSSSSWGSTTKYACEPSLWFARSGIFITQNISPTKHAPKYIANTPDVPTLSSMVKNELRTKMEAIWRMAEQMENSFDLYGPRNISEATVQLNGP
mmetsp:Transcript_19751/g.37149  ORF Transcript_19751/g.37149 Transcript_19751/m.37149 type:complete len:100 (-) Transcript_19751:524-823(-)